MDDAYSTLRRLIDETPGSVAQLRLAYESAKRGEHAASQFHCCIVADLIAMAHPDEVDDPILLVKVLGRLFTE